MARRRFVDAIREGLREEMERSDEVLLLGEDVALGGPFGATRGLAEAFGEERVKNTPISEAAVMGLAVGAAALGARPVVEVMFIDFATLVMDQLVNHAAKLHYMSGGQLSVPLTVRSSFGLGGGWGAQHSQSLESWFAHVPGLKVAAPASAGDAKGLLKAAIRDDAPVLLLEHRSLYFTSGDVPNDEAIVPLGHAAVRRRGRDMTVVTWSAMLAAVLDAAKVLSGEGIEVEVVDVRTLLPLDLDTIVASVRRTNRAVVLHEAVTTGGVGAEVAAAVQEAAFDYLDLPVRRLGAAFTPIPASPELERRLLPDAARIQSLLRDVAASR